MLTHGIGAACYVAMACQPLCRVLITTAAWLWLARLTSQGPPFALRCAWLVPQRAVDLDQGAAVALQRVAVLLASLALEHGSSSSAAAVLAAS